MKKVVVLLLVLIMTMSVYAVTFDVVYDSTEQTSFTPGDGAQIPVRLALTGENAPEKVVVGFSTSEITAIDGVPSGDLTEITLKPVTKSEEDHVAGTAYLDKEIYVFYQIQSGSNLDVMLSTGALKNSDRSKSLNWKVSNADGEPVVFSIGDTSTGSISYKEEKLADHDGSVKYSSVDSIKLAMETASYGDLPADNYSAYLTVTVRTSGDN